MKRNRTLLSLVFCALLLLLPPCRASAADGAELEIPFAFQNDSPVAHTCSAVIEPLEAAPAPAQSQAEAESGGQGRFVLRFSHSGKFQYQIYQTAKDLSGVIFDDRVYTVTIAVRSTETGDLVCSLWATLDGEEKVDAIAFVNRGEIPIDEPSPVPSSEPSPVPSSEPSPAPSPEPSPLPSPEPDASEQSQSPQTGDNSRLELYLAAMAASALMLGFMVTVTKQKEGDGI